MSIYKNFYDSITPEKDNAAFAYEIKNSRRPVKKPNIKRFAVAGVAAATAAAVTITGSANGWDFGSIIHSWFGENEDIALENATPVTAENVTDNFDALDFEIRGAVSDDNIAVIFMDVTRTDGKGFDGAEYEVLWENGRVVYSDNINKIPMTDIPKITFDTAETTIYTSKPTETLYDENGELCEIRHVSEPYLPAIKQFIVDDGNPADNLMTMAICLDVSEIKQNNENTIFLNLSDLTTQKLYRPGLEKQTRKGVILLNWFTDEEITGSWSADISFDFEESKKISVNPNEKVELTFFNHTPDPEKLQTVLLEFTLTELSVSDVSVSLTLEAPLYDEPMYQFINETGELVLKDGTTIKFGEDSQYSPYFVFQQGEALEPEIQDIAPYYERGGKWIIEDKFMLETPIDINEVDYVKIGEKTFEF